MTLSIQSPSFFNRTPSRIVFLIDTHRSTPFSHDTLDTSVTEIQLALLRILLYFHDYVDRHVIWGYRIFNSCKPLIENDRGIFYDISTRSLEQFATHLREELLFFCRDSEAMLVPIVIGAQPSTGSTPFAKLKVALVQLLTDFSYDDIDFGYAVSPKTRGRTPRASSKASSKVPITVKNYLYVLTSVPHTHAELAWYVDGPSQDKGIQTFLTVEGQKKEILNLLERVRDGMLAKGLWDAYIDRRMSINWIDTTGFGKTGALSTQRDVDHLIQLNLASILHTFGGKLIPFGLLNDNLLEFGVSFASLFRHYHSKQIDTSIGLRLRQKKTVQKRAEKDLVAELPERKEQEFWEGSLILGKCEDNSDPLLPLKALPLISLPTNPLTHIGIASDKHPYISFLDQITSLRVTAKISQLSLLPLICSQLGDHNVPEALFACIAKTDTVRDYIRFSTLIKCLQMTNEVLLVELIEEGKKSGRLALFEPILEGCAALRILPKDTNPQAILDTHCLDSELECEDNLLPDVDPQGSSLLDRSSMLDFGHITTGEQLFSLDVEIPHELCNTLEIIDSHGHDATLPDPFYQQGGISSLDSAYGSDLSFDSPKVRANSLEDLLEKVSKLYWEILYTEKISVVDLIVLGFQMAEEEIKYLEADANNDGKMLAKYALLLRDGLIISLESFERKYRETLPDLLVQASEMDSDTKLNGEELKCLSIWKEDVIERIGRGNLNIKLKSLKIKEAQLQILLYLELCRLNAILGMSNLSIPTPDNDSAATLPSKKSKSTKRSRHATEEPEPEPQYQLERYFEWLCISDAVGNALGSLKDTLSPKNLNKEAGIKTFCTDVVIKFYQESLPSIVHSLWVKCGGDFSTPKPSVSSPLRSPEKRKLIQRSHRSSKPQPKNDSTTTSATTARSQSINKENLPGATRARRRNHNDHISALFNREFTQVKQLRRRSNASNVTTTTASAAAITATGTTTTTSNGPNRKVCSKKKGTTQNRMIEDGDTELIVLRMKNVPGTPTTPRKPMQRFPIQDSTPTRRGRGMMGKRLISENTMSPQLSIPSPTSPISLAHSPSFSTRHYHQRLTTTTKLTHLDSDLTSFESQQTPSKNLWNTARFPTEGLKHNSTSNSKCKMQKTIITPGNEMVDPFMVEETPIKKITGNNLLLRHNSSISISSSSRIGCGSLFLDDDDQDDEVKETPLKKFYRSRLSP